MKLVVLSHKVCWRDPSSPSGYVSDGGFPFQMQAISQLFDHTRLIILEGANKPAGARALTGHGMEVRPLPAPTGTNLRRKLSMLSWMPRYLPSVWRQVRRADAVHAAVPGDVGTLGVLIAVAQGKRLLVRHCGTWGEPVTAADRFLLWLLERIAGGRHVVLATGGSDAPPSSRNPAIRWIFSTSLWAEDLARIPRAVPWRAGEPLRLVTVGRLVAAKNTAATVGALALVRERYPEATLDVVGHGNASASLKALAGELGITGAVTLHGNVAHRRVLEILSASHLFVFPTRVKEGFPKALLEAMACGLPVVATAVSVIPQLVGDRCGIVLRETDPEAVARAILQLIDDEGRLAEISANARRTSHAYSLETWRDEIATCLEEGWGSPSEAHRPAGNRERTAVSSAGVKIQTATGVDELALDAFLRRFFPTSRCEFLHRHGGWWHRGQRHRMMVTVDGAIAGYCAIIPARCRIDGEVHRARWWVDLVVDPTFRGRGLQSLMDRKIQEPAELLLGFPNPLAARIHRKHGWGVSEQHRMMMLSFEPTRLRPILRATGVRGAALRMAARLARPFGQGLRKRAARYRPVTARRLENPEPEALAELFARHQSAAVITTERDAAYLNWRYFEAPYRDELSFFVAGEPAPRIAAITRSRETVGGRSFKLLDLFGDLEDLASTADLLRLVARQAAREQAVEVTAFVTRPGLFPLFRSAGFLLRVRGRSCWLSSDPAIMRLFQRREVHWTLGDSDHENPA